MKKLATIERIKEFKKHPNADRLNLITIKGWQCVTAEQYEVGDLVIYIQVDTTVPKVDWADFLFAREKEGAERARIKSIKLRGETSQGLCLPLCVLPEQFHIDTQDEPNLEGYDVTELLGIEKYEKPVPVSLSGEVEGDFPTHLVPKTDEERCLAEHSVLVTEDGEKTIGEICETKYSGKILSYNIETGKNEYKQIVDWNISSGCDDWYEIELDDGKVVTITGNHRVWVDELSCYRRVCDLVGTEEFLVV